MFAIWRFVHSMISHRCSGLVFFFYYLLLHSVSHTVSFFFSSSLLMYVVCSFCHLTVIWMTFFSLLLGFSPFFSRHHSLSLCLPFSVLCSLFSLFTLSFYSSVASFLCTLFECGECVREYQIVGSRIFFLFFYSCVFIHIFSFSHIVCSLYHIFLFLSCVCIVKK